MPTHLHAILFHENFQAKALEQVLGTANDVVLSPVFW